LLALIASAVALLEAFISTLALSADAALEAPDKAEAILLYPHHLIALLATSVYSPPTVSA